MSNPKFWGHYSSPSSHITTFDDHCCSYTCLSFSDVSIPHQSFLVNTYTPLLNTFIMDPHSSVYLFVCNSVKILRLQRLSQQSIKFPDFLNKKMFRLPLKLFSLVAFKVVPSTLNTPTPNVSSILQSISGTHSLAENFPLSTEKLQPFNFIFNFGNKKVL